jgi:hypothetical protein
MFGPCPTFWVGDAARDHAHLALIDRDRTRLRIERPLSRLSGDTLDARRASIQAQGEYRSQAPEGQGKRLGRCSRLVARVRDRYET